MTHPITWASVLTSGARMSALGPMTLEMAWVKLLVAASSSRSDKEAGSSVIPPLAPPKGRSSKADFQVINEASARTSSRSVSGWKRRPPLKGPRAPLCWTRYPRNVSTEPLSAWMGTWTSIWRYGSASRARMYPSMLRISAARSTY